MNTIKEFFIILSFIFNSVGVLIHASLSVLNLPITLYASFYVGQEIYKLSNNMAFSIMCGLITFSSIARSFYYFVNDALNDMNKQINDVTENIKK